MKRPTQPPSRSNDVEIVGSTTFEKLWQEIADDAKAPPDPREGWKATREIARLRRCSFSGAHQWLTSRENEGQFERVTGRGDGGILVHYWRPIPSKFTPTHRVRPVKRC